MKRLLMIISVFATIAVQAQNDTTITRIVTVERDFQPVIQSAGKINQRPTIISNEIQLTPVVYSTYSTPLSIDYNISQLPVAETRFTPQAPLNGAFEIGAGYRNTHLLFGYQIHQKKNMSLNIYANHDAYWGINQLSLSQSQLGMLVSRHFSNADLYFGIEGKNDAYTNFPLNTWQTLWNAKAKLGVQSTTKSAIQYRIQTGYNAFAVSNLAFEHSIQSHLDIWWANQQHSAGVKAYVQNTFYTTSQLELQMPSARHNIRIQPFYECRGKHVHLHAGVNIDMNIGTGELLLPVENVSLAPSPNVQFEWNMMDNIFHFYANATGQYGLGSWEEYMNYNRYLDTHAGLLWNSPRAYTPVDAQFGFKLRPAKTLLIDFYGGYAYMINACNMQAAFMEDMLNYQLWVSNYQRWKVGANLHYHYRDIIEFNLGGNYYFYRQEPADIQDELYYDANSSDTPSNWTTTVFDRPNWDAYARVDIHIDSKWSFYSENYFIGSRQAYLAPHKSAELRPIISLNLGGQYAINRWLNIYAELNDYLNRKDEIFYGYKSQGIHFLVGVKWKF